MYYVFGIFEKSFMILINEDSAWMDGINNFLVEVRCWRRFTSVYPFIIHIFAVIGTKTEFMGENK